MKKEKNRKIYSILALATGLILIFTVLLFKYTTGEFVLSEKEMEKYYKYELSILEHTTLEDILPFCTEVKKENLKDMELTVLTSNKLINFLGECEKIEEIAILKDKGSPASEVCAITYIAHDGSLVYLEYNKEGLLRLSVFNERKNTYVVIEDGAGTLQRNFI